MALTYQKPKDDDIDYRQRLVNYGQNTNDGLDEYKRAMGVYRSKSALGDTEGAAAAQKWAGQVDTAIGGLGTRPQSEVRNTLETYKANLNKPVTPYSFDINNNQQYQQALQAAQRSAQTASNNATVALGSRGIGNSQQAMTTANQIQQRSVADVNANMLPQIMAQDYARYRDQQNMEMARNEGLLGYANALSGIDQQELDNKFRDSQAAEQKKQNNIDLAKWGASVYGFGAPKDDAGVFFDQYQGAKSLPFMQYEQSKAVQDAGLTGLYNGKETMQKNAQDFGQWLDKAQLAVSQRNAGTSAASAANSASNAGFNRLLDIWDRTGKAPAGLESMGITPGTALNDKNAIKEAEKVAAEKSKKMESEKTGLANALNSGDISYSDAEKSIQKDLALGFYTPDEAAELNTLLKQWASAAYGQRWN